jgi:hypothetical protein
MIRNVRYWPLVDIPGAPHMSAFGGKADMTSYSTFGKSGHRAPQGSLVATAVGAKWSMRRLLIAALLFVATPTLAAEAPRTKPPLDLVVPEPPKRSPTFDVPADHDLRIAPDDKLKRPPLIWTQPPNPLPPPREYPSLRNPCLHGLPLPQCPRLQQPWHDWPPDRLRIERRIG